MTRIFVIAIGTAFLALAGSASADQDAERRATLRGRQVVWQAPAAERPHALTGERAEAKSERPDRLRPRGRAGFVRR